jgi:hypothetical protein
VSPSWPNRRARASRGRIASLWRPDDLGVALYPDRLVLARVGGVWPRRLTHREIIDLAPAEGDTPAWQPALEALARLAMDGALARAHVTLVLSSHFVHYTLVPWSALLRSEEDQLAFARQRLVSVHGSAAAGWSLRLSQAEPRRPRLACGVPQALIDALDEVMAPLGGRYRSLQPYLMASFNRWRARLGARPGWFVAAEPGLACLALLEDGHWQSVRAIRIGAGWPKQLPDVLARERFLVDAQADCRQVSVFAPGLPAAVSPEGGDWVIENLEPTSLPGMTAGVDGRFAIAVGG